MWLEESLAKHRVVGREKRGEGHRLGWSGHTESRWILGSWKIRGSHGCQPLDGDSGRSMPLGLLGSSQLGIPLSQVFRLRTPGILTNCDNAGASDPYLSQINRAGKTFGIISTLTQ